MRLPPPTAISSTVSGGQWETPSRFTKQHSLKKEYFVDPLIKEVSPGPSVSTI